MGYTTQFRLKPDKNKINQNSLVIKLPWIIEVKFYIRSL